MWALVRMRELGFSEADLLTNYPRLEALDLVEAWSYADHYQEEIHKAIKDNEED